MPFLKYTQKHKYIQKNIAPILLIIFIAGASELLCQTVWTAKNSGTQNWLHSIVWTGAQLVAVGEKGTIITSKDGNVWALQKSGVITTLKSVAWTGTLLVAVGESILTSPDGFNWTKRDIPANMYFWNVIWNGSQLVATDNPTYISSDGVIWEAGTTYPPNTPPMFDIVWTGSVYVAAGDFSFIWRSPDGKTWGKNNSLNLPTLWAITWDGKRIIGAGDGIHASADGIDWNIISTLPEHSSNRAYLRFIRWLNGMYYCSRYNELFTSKDAITWMKQNTGTDRRLLDIAFTGTQFVVVGDSGAIITSPLDVDIIHKPCMLKQDKLLSLTYKTKKYAVSIPHIFNKREIIARIYSIAGKKVFEKSIPCAGETVELDVRNIPAGRYALVLQCAGINIAESFVIIQ